MPPELTGALTPPLDDWSDSYAAYREMARPQRGWATTCLGGHQLGETCLHRFAENRWTPAELCEGCTRLLMDVLNRELPDLRAVWVPVWLRRAGLPEGGGHRAG